MKHFIYHFISNTVLNYIYDNHHQRLRDWNRTPLSPAKLEEYARAISDKGAALKNCFGFIDGTVRATCRPGENQREVYNGHKKSTWTQISMFLFLME